MMAATWPTTTTGSKGEDVRTVQHLLAVHGHPVAVDGVFGPATASAVKAFQSSQGLTANGVVDDRTWKELVVTVGPGASGSQVRALQGQLASQGWRLAVDGVLGPQTTRSVRDFQTAHHLTVDGVAGPATWHELVAGFVRVGSPDLAADHLHDAWGANDRARALRNATQAAVDLLLRGTRGTLNFAGCSPNPQLGAGHFVCSYTYEGGAVNLNTRGNSIDGYYVESASFIAD
jgi:peptidoglycan hydrolase-like protein with peptidoglycan-binding domain